MREYNIISTDCDCGSGRIAKLSGISYDIWVLDPRCPFCNNELGPHWDLLSKHEGILADGELEALQKHRKEVR